jgi:hypothetical protein
MAFPDYTTANSVRAVLGISVKEASDAVIEDPVYLTGVLEVLYDLSTTLVIDYSGARDASPRTDKQTRFVLLVQTFCAYTVALQLIPNLPLLAPQIITDGKTAINRVANPYENLRPSIVASLAYFKLNLIEAYAAINSAIAVPTPKRRTMVAGVGLATDPVTG